MTYEMPKWPAWQSIETAPHDGTHIIVPSQWTGMEIDEVCYDETLPSGQAWWSCKIEQSIDEPSCWLPIPPLLPGVE